MPARCLDSKPLMDLFVYIMRQPEGIQLTHFSIYIRLESVYKNIVRQIKNHRDQREIRWVSFSQCFRSLSGLHRSRLSSRVCLGMLKLTASHITVLIGGRLNWQHSWPDFFFFLSQCLWFLSYKRIE